MFPVLFLKTFFGTTFFFTNIYEIFYIIFLEITFMTYFSMNVHKTCTGEIVDYLPMEISRITKFIMVRREAFP